MARWIFAAVCALYFIACDSVSGVQIDNCARACERGGQAMDSCTDKVCKCRDAASQKGGPK